MSRGRAAPPQLKAAALELASQARELGIHGGMPDYDQEKDRSVRELAAYVPTAAGLRRSRRVRRFYGPSGGDRAALWWVYGLGRDRDLDEGWRSFWRSLTDPDWHYGAVAQLQNFACDEPEVGFEDGISIVLRDLRAIASRLGWDYSHVRDALVRDWSDGGGFGTHVLIAEERLPKAADNVVQGNTGTELPRIGRLLTSLWLTAAGDVNVGRVYIGRRAVGAPHGLMTSVPGVTAHHGETYKLMPEAVGQVRELQGWLLEFERNHLAKLPHVGTALSRFRGTFHRPWTAAPDRLVDCITALEALVAAGTAELSATVASRVCWLLAENESERVRIFRDLKLFYDTRSRLVHGGPLKPKHHDMIAREPELRAIVRRAVLGFLNLTNSAEFYPTPDLKDRLDEILLTSADRTRLRSAMFR